MPLNILNRDELFHQGVAFQNAGRLDDARRCYLELLKFNPTHSQSLHNLGLVELKVGRSDLALSHLNRSIQLNPANADAHNALGEVHRAQLAGSQAIACYDKAIELNPRLVEAYNNRAVVKFLLGQMTAGLDDWQKVLEITQRDPSANGIRAMTYNNLGNAYLELGDPAKAVASHKHAVELDPNYISGISNLLRDHNHITDISPEQLLALHRDWAARCVRGIVPLKGGRHDHSPDPDRRLRIGFVSPDFRAHAVAYFLMGLFDRYDKSAFEFVGYASVNNPDAFTAWIQQRCHVVKNILGLADEHVARLIQQDNIDILIDLAGHTAGNRFCIFAYKPAPVQVTYLGYPVTVGLDTIDWRLTDRFADPPGMTDSHFAERLWRLDRPAWCYHPPVEVPADALPPVTRNAPAPFTFGSFNGYAKVTPEMIRLWSEILKQVPGSRLFLKSNVLQDPAAHQRVQTQFSQHGIPPECLLLRGRQSTTADHLLQYQDVDLALDTFPYHGTTTTCEALYMNVPVVTLEGTTHMSRVGVSLLSALGLQELIAPTPDQYIATAVRLATNIPALTALRMAGGGLRSRLQNSPLMDESDFAQAFCNALRGMWQSWCATNH